MYRADASPASASASCMRRSPAPDAPLLRAHVLARAARKVGNRGAIARASESCFSAPTSSSRARARIPARKGGNSVSGHARRADSTTRSASAQFRCASCCSNASRCCASRPGQCSRIHAPTVPKSICASARSRRGGAGSGPRSVTACRNPASFPMLSVARRAASVAASIPRDRAVVRMSSRQEVESLGAVATAACASARAPEYLPRRKRMSARSDRASARFGARLTARSSAASGASSIPALSISSARRVKARASSGCAAVCDSSSRNASSQLPRPSSMSASSCRAVA